MPIQTVWGLIKSRDTATRGSRTCNVLLKDNPALDPLFKWLTNLKIESVESFQNERIKEAVIKISIENEIKWFFKSAIDFPMLQITNQIPLQGNFLKGTQELLNSLHQIMYNPEKFMEF